MKKLLLPLCGVIMAALTAAPAHADPYCDVNGPQFNPSLCSEGDPSRDIACDPNSPAYDPQYCVIDQGDGGDPPLYVPDD